ncbi:MAG TPA: hypothetical protein VLA82_06875 [Actinomycetota bacterium]|nr:hypothetical protein [Actinomycetota bacterium]
MAPSGKNLIRVELSFVTDDDADALGDRIRESVANIVGRQAIEEFRVRSMPLGPKHRPLRSVDEG